MVAFAGLLLVPGAAAQTPPEQVLTGADISRAGRIDLTVFAPGGSVATYYERIGSRRVRLGSRVFVGDNLARLDRATTWRCDRLVRRFEVDAVGPDGRNYRGAYSVRTPSCRFRFALTTPQQVPRGRRVAVAIEDGWRLGDAKPRLCIARPGARARCRVQALLPGQARRTYRFTPRQIGTWKVRLRAGGARPLRELRVGAAGTKVRSAPRPVVLTTGDSTIQGVDGFLADQLGASARVVARIRPGTALFKPGRPSWLQTARAQSSAVRPAATVVSLGINDGYPIRTADGQRLRCCSERWVGIYTQARADDDAVLDALRRPGRVDDAAADRGAGAGPAAGRA